jgi:hypothetical protein
MTSKLFTFKIFSICCYLFILFWGEGWDWVLNSELHTFAKNALYHLSCTSSPFCSGYFGGGISETISLGWPQSVILPISASQVARITGTSHQYWIRRIYEQK